MGFETRLTSREKDVFEELLLGLGNKEIGLKLKISHRTVEDHRWHIFHKFRVRNAVELVRVVYGIKQFGPTAGVTQ